MDMTRKLILAAWALLLAAAVPAQQKEEFRLWPEAGKYAPERLGAGFDRDNAPYVTLYRPEGKKPAPAVVVCPAVPTAAWLSAMRAIRWRSGSRRAGLPPSC